MKSLGVLGLGIVTTMVLFFGLQFLSDRSLGYSRYAAKGQRRKLGRWLTDAYAYAITDLAVILAGRRRSALWEEWDAHLFGDPDHKMSTWPKLRAASGFMLAAVIFRFQDAADLAWIPIDVILRSRLLSNLNVLLPVVAATAILFRHGGFDAVIGNAENLTAIGAAFYTLIRIGRWWRRIKPRDPKSHGKREREDV